MTCVVRWLQARETFKSCSHTRAALTGRVTRGRRSLTGGYKCSLHGPKRGPLPSHVRGPDARRDPASPSLAGSLHRDEHTYSFSNVDNPKKEPFLSSWILLLFRILWGENVRQ